MSSGYTKSGDTELAFYVEGSGEQTVLLIMGLGGRAADWGPMLTHDLAATYRVVRFDNRGTGQSSRVTQAFTLDDMARDALQVLDAVGAAKAHVVGYSMGGMIAQLMALDHPHRVDRLALLSTHFGGAAVERPGPRGMKVFDPEEYAGRDAASMARFSLEMIAAEGWADANPDALDTLVGYAAERPTSARTFLAQINAVHQSDRSERVRDIAHPTLVVHGTEDPLIPVSNGRNLATRIENARLELLTGCGHVIAWERAGELGRLLREFFEAGR